MVAVANNKDWKSLNVAVRDKASGAVLKSLRDLFPAPWGVKFSGERVHTQEP